MSSKFEISSAMLVAVLLTAGVASAADDEHAAHHPTTAAATVSADVMASMKKMQQQMAAIHASKDPKERARLLDEHMQSMQSTMQQMHQGPGCMMMGSDHAMPGAPGGGMNMMQMMMDQMMQHQKAMQGK